VQRRDLEGAHDVQKMRGRGLHLDHHGAVIRRGHAKAARILRLAVRDRLGAFDLHHRVEIIALLADRRRVQRAEDGIDEFLRRDRVAVRPFQPFPQMESIGLAIFGHVPAFRLARLHLAARAIGHKPLIGVHQDPACCRVEVHLRVKARPFRADPPIQHRVRHPRPRRQRQSRGRPGQPPRNPACLSDHLRHSLSCYGSVREQVALPLRFPFPPHGTGPALSGRIVHSSCRNNSPVVGARISARCRDAASVTWPSTWPSVTRSPGCGDPGHDPAEGGKDLDRAGQRHFLGRSVRRGGVRRSARRRPPERPSAPRHPSAASASVTSCCPRYSSVVEKQGIRAPPRRSGRARPARARYAPRRRHCRPRYPRSAPASTPVQRARRSVISGCAAEDA
jgi:hypothetical protein